MSYSSYEIGNTSALPGRSKSCSGNRESVRAVKQATPKQTFEKTHNIIYIYTPEYILYCTLEIGVRKQQQAVAQDPAKQEILNAIN